MTNGVMSELVCSIGTYKYEAMIISRSVQESCRDTWADLHDGNYVLFFKDGIVNHPGTVKVFGTEPRSEEKRADKRLYEKALEFLEDCKSIRDSTRRGSSRKRA